MSPEQKGRGGKKPKYQIADIGGSDLTSQDVSTERVLNFLIRGEHTPSDAGGADASPLPDKSPETAAVEQPEIGSGAPKPEPEPRPRKGLDYLFERANSAKAGEQLKGLKLRPDVADFPSPPSPPPVEPELHLTERVKGEEPPAKEVAPTTLPHDSSGVMAKDSPDIPIPRPERGRARKSKIIEEEQSGTLSVEVDVQMAELARQMELWRGFYRLKDGEVEALKAFYTMSHAAGSPECYVKMQKLAEMSNLTYRYCQKVVRSLESLGWITRLKEYDPIDQLGVLYRVNLKPSNPVL